MLRRAIVYVVISDNRRQAKGNAFDCAGGVNLISNRHRTTPASKPVLCITSKTVFTHRTHKPKGDAARASVCCSGRHYVTCLR
ncbi:MAG: hypothetical protein EBZ81_15825 [Betaproteobacteria bacterium]|nr:hypothetical protein [Betaproteobacteria bacterium]